MFKMLLKRVKGREDVDYHFLNFEDMEANYL